MDPRPLRVGEKTAGLWIAPYIDTQDVITSRRGCFVVKPSAWGTPRELKPEPPPRVAPILTIRRYHACPET
ncbi:hypothetical protein AU254_20465 [Yersinia pestis]|nr:hypothetical protein AU254_20465 [Yersinia pestis]